MTATLEQIVFWTCAGLLAYVYIGYPLLVYLVSRVRPLTVKKSPFAPLTTVLITAYNEEKDIAAKLENTLQIDYPPEKLEILVVSDCSNDRTDEIVKSFAERGVKLYRQLERHARDVVLA